MRAIVVEEAGGPEALEVAEVPDPVAGPGEVVLRVAATAVNRADLMQRMGRYPPPPGASDILGLEASGTVAELGGGVAGWAPGDRTSCRSPPPISSWLRSVRNWAWSASPAAARP